MEWRGRPQARETLTELPTREWSPRPLEAPNPSPSPSRARQKALKATYMRRYRRRCARGIKIARTPYDAGTLDKLIDLGWLKPEDAGDVDKVGLAFYRAVRSVK
jgi:hypothetical protein